MISPKVTSPKVTGAGVTSLSRVAKQGSASEIMVRIRTTISISRPSLWAGTFDDLTQGDLTQGDLTRGDRCGRDFALACREAGFCFRNYGSDSNDNFNSATITSGGHFR